jgi:ABC-type transport system involved in cytochrome bd biosynthesis fused ATPase/permease subunit
VHLHSVSTLIIVDLPFASPDGRPLGGRLTGEVSAGHPAVISGPSGCGKTTLLKTIAGWLEYGGQGDILFDGASAGMALRRRSVHLGLHDAAILYDTVHENLFAPDASEDELWRALDAVELSDRIRQAGGLEGWIAQTDFSLGEAHRLSLARAWLSPLPVILIDEPEAHLDREQAARIMDRLHKRFADQVFIYSSHNRESGEEQLLLTIASSG